MSFDSKYLEWNQKRIKGIVDFYGHKFFYYKKILDLGCGQADISGVLHRLGADITAVDGRQEHLKNALKKFPGIKTIKSDLDSEWAFKGKHFDLVLDLDLLCHLNNYETHLKSVCNSTNHLVLETPVCDFDDAYKCIVKSQDKGVANLSLNGVNSMPTIAAIERVLTECKMNFRRIDSNKFNSGNFTYDWKPQNNQECNINKRSIWFAVKNSCPIQFRANSTVVECKPNIVLPSSNEVKKVDLIPINDVNDVNGINQSFITFKELGKCGRLGNQLFQMAALIGLASRTNSDIKVKWYCTYTKKLIAPYLKNQIWEDTDMQSPSFTYKEPYFNYAQVPYTKNMNIHGYFQSEKYFADCKELVMNAFEPSEELVNKIKSKYGSLLDGNTCSIHVRRGDYVGNKTYYQCDLNYFNNALNKINSLEKIDNFIVLSDDIAWCKRNFPPHFTFIDGNIDIEDLYLISLCKHNIMSNSSFSWWGAWLNKNVNKKIIAPRLWFSERSGINDRDIYYESMIKI